MATLDDACVQDKAVSGSDITLKSHRMRFSGKQDKSLPWEDEADQELSMLTIEI